MRSIIFNQHQVNHALKNEEGMFRVVVSSKTVKHPICLLYWNREYANKLLIVADKYIEMSDKAELDLKELRSYEVLMIPSCQEEVEQSEKLRKTFAKAGVVAIQYKISQNFLMPKFEVGETIFVKESFATSLGSLQIEDVKYSADQQNLYGFIGRDDWRNRPAQHMKQEHSRLTPRIKSVKVERLQDISEEDAIAEGVEKNFYGYKDYSKANIIRGDAKDSFRTLWNSTHKKPEEKWEANPWVFAYEYEVVR